jgi:Ca2+-binding RTX toxin-like protein
MPTINGTFLPDILLGTPDNDIINGLGGLDTISGGDGDDIIDGGEGDDILFGGGGNDILIGGLGAATLLSLYNGGTGNDIMVASQLGLAEDFDGGDGIDTVSFQARTQGVTTFLSLLGIPLLDTLRNVENVIGSRFNDEITGDGGNNRFDGGTGADTLTGKGGNDIYFVDNAGDRVFEEVGGGYDALYTTQSYALAAGQEVEWLSASAYYLIDPIALYGNEFANCLLGDDGANLLDGGGGVDLIVGYGGNDTYFFDNGSDYALESVGGGYDAIYTSASYVLAADMDIEWLSTADNGNTQSISLVGNGAGQCLVGNNGINVLDGAGGIDAFIGYGGMDTFRFTTALGPDNVDLILDFVSQTDKIAIDDAFFTGLALGQLDPTAFVVGTAAGDANDRIIYNNVNGQLFFDADGNGAGAAVLFAHLHGAPALAASDFQII